MRKPAKKTTIKSTPPATDTRKALLKVAGRIKQLRIKRGYTSYEIFAFENNINRAQFGRYERGEDLRISTLFKLLNALEVTPKEFFSEGFDS